jgi:hypothetical protein
MLRVINPDDTESIVVPDSKIAMVRTVLDWNPTPEEFDAFKRLFALGPERIRALCDLADSQLQLEGLLADPSARGAGTRAASRATSAKGGSHRMRRVAKSSRATSRKPSRARDRGARGTRGIARWVDPDQTD